jgi:ATP/maltotriose-dependent transcriptional regulator MalT
VRTSDKTAGWRSDLDHGRKAVARSAWAEAFEALSLADRSSRLAADDMYLLATAAYLTGRAAECVSALRRACELYAQAGQPRRAARAVFWIAFVLGNQGDSAQAAGWLARAGQLLESQPADCAERGLLLGAIAFGHNMAGEFDQAHDVAARAAEIGRHNNDPDVRGLALTQYGGALVKLGRARDALALLDEAMVAVVSAEISPIAAGTIYCTVISICREMAELRRAREWTEALDAWCGKQQDMVMFSRQCLVHRAELLHLQGQWPEAVEEAQRACDRLAGTVDAFATGAARYQQAEVLRVCGDLDAADQAYRQAVEWGHEPCPGLALLRMAQGDLAAARAAIRRALGETADPLRRARLLPAQVEIALAAGDDATAGDVSTARQAAEELAATAGRYGTAALRASSEYAHGAVLLVDGDPAGALTTLRTACALWRDLDVPYEATRARVLIALACRLLGDQDTARLELDAAARVFARLGAEPDRVRAERLATPQPSRSGGLTDREVQVLRLVAAGKSNRAIATELVLSEKTIERHVSNLYAKIGVASRAAATAYAYEHRLV